VVLLLALAGCGGSSLSADDAQLCERDAVYVEVLQEDLGGTLADRHWSTKYEAAAIAEVAVRPLAASLRSAQPQDAGLRQAMSDAEDSLTDLALTMGIVDGGAPALADDARLLRAAVEDLEALAEACG
jgi:hypothetical protein